MSWIYHFHNNAGSVSSQLVRSNLDQLSGQLIALALEHRAFLLRPGTAAAQHITLAGFAVGLLDQTHLQTILHGFPVGLLQQSPLVGAQPALRRADQIPRFALAQECEVGLRDRPTVHHPDAFSHTVFCFHRGDDASSVVTSARLPANTSKLSGRPSGVQTRPMQTCLLPLRWSRE